MRKILRIITYRRKRKGLTDYRKRLKLLISNMPRLVVRKSLKNIIGQVIEYKKEGDNVLLSAHSRELLKFGWKADKSNIPSSYLVGLLLGKKAKEKGIKTMVLDIGLNKSVKGSRIYALLKGVIDAGIDVPHSDNILPSEDRIKGAHISKLALHLKNDEAAYKKTFSLYIKNGIEPERIASYLDDVKKKILGA